MYYSRLLKLNNLISDDKIKLLNKYFLELTENTKKNITVSKISRVLGISLANSTKVLMKCNEIGILSISYGIKCPECNMSIIRTDDIDDIPGDLISCYSCEKDVTITTNDIEVLFSLDNSISFNQGQQEIKDSTISAIPVAHEDTLDYILKAGSALNEIFYNPTNLQYEELGVMYKSIFKNLENTKEIGDTLEGLVIKLFNICKAFNAKGIKTITNQIDCFVRNKMFIPFGVLNDMGGQFIIECKNEKKTPKGEYMSKIHSIIHTTNGRSKHVKFGIVISKEKPPKTFKSLANKYYLAHDIVIISIHGDEIKELIDKKENLLELIERKINEIKFDATTDLKKIGLYGA
jgi:hypothetical protein